MNEWKIGDLFKVKEYHQSLPVDGRVGIVRDTSIHSVVFVYILPNDTWPNHFIDSRADKEQDYLYADPRYIEKV